MDTAQSLGGLIDRLREARLPVCPRVRSAQTKWPNAVDGYCVLGFEPGYMIPSLVEYRSYCTTSLFSQCPWFRAPGGEASRRSRSHAPALFQP
jgi:hypothetical protein